MFDYNTLGHNLKRGIFRFCEKISNGLHRSEQKFIAHMIYGLLASRSCYLTEIARELKEKVTLKKTVEHLSHNLADFDDAEKLTEQYMQLYRRIFVPFLIVDVSTCGNI